MLTELKCGKTHVQLFHGDECVATVRIEYKDAVAIAIENQIAGSLASIANGTEVSNSTEEK